MSGSVRQFTSSLARLALPLVIGMALSASPAAAVLVDVNSVTGQWLSATPSNLAALQGLGTNEIRWGTPAEGQQSGYRFDGAAPPTTVNLPLEASFHLGQLTHFNFPIWDSITGAVLEVTANLTVHDDFAQNIVLTSQFVIGHEETPNALPCHLGSESVCDDIVTFAINAGNSSAFTHDNVQYFVDIRGFFLGGNLATEFWTRERDISAAELRGIVTAAPGVRTAEVSAPLSLALLGVGAAAALIQRRRRPLA